MTEGEGIKRIMTAPGPIPSTMSQYTRVHNRLGVQLGPGVEREMSVRKAYNILTGKLECPLHLHLDNFFIAQKNVLILSITAHFKSCGVFGKEKKVELHLITSLGK